MVSERDEEGKLEATLDKGDVIVTGREERQELKGNIGCASSETSNANYICNSCSCDCVCICDCECSNPYAEQNSIWKKPY